MYGIIRITDIEEGKLSPRGAKVVKMSSEWSSGIDTSALPELTRSALSIYRRSNIVCLTQGHNIIDVLATYHSLNDTVIKLPAQYCTDCDKLFISEEEYNRHRRLLRYHFIPTRIQYVTSSGFYSCTDSPFLHYRADKSPLKLCGYSVSQKEGLPDNIREDILRFVIEERILSRSDVINYLELFIATNGLKKNMEYAVQKWRDDLHFVYMYDFRVRATAQVTSIRPYSRRS